MAMSEELWEKMQDGKEVHIVDSPEDVAVKEGKNLCWKGTKTRVPAQYIFGEEWELVKEEEKEIETEKWMRSNSDMDGFIDEYSEYTNPEGNKSLQPSVIMNRLDFLRWVGTMPKEAHIPWPGDRWCLWFRSNEDGYYNEYYEKGAGYTIQVFAEYSEMRVEK